jgi:hypothetical protein
VAALRVVDHAEDLVLKRRQLRDAAAQVGAQGVVFAHHHQQVVAVFTNDQRIRYPAQRRRVDDDPVGNLGCDLVKQVLQRRRVQQL